MCLEKAGDGDAAGAAGKPSEANCVSPATEISIDFPSSGEGRHAVPTMCFSASVFNVGARSCLGVVEMRSPRCRDRHPCSELAAHKLMRIESLVRL